MKPAVGLGFPGDLSVSHEYGTLNDNGDLRVLTTRETQQGRHDFQDEAASMRTLLMWFKLPVIVWRLLWDRRMPLVPKIIIALAIAYFILPMGIIPDRAFGLVGYLDDIALLILAIAWFMIRAPEPAVRDAERRE